MYQKTDEDPLTEADEVTFNQPGNRFHRVSTRVAAEFQSKEKIRELSDFADFWRRILKEFFSRHSDLCRRRLECQLK